MTKKKQEIEKGKLTEKIAEIVRQIDVIETENKGLQEVVVGTGDFILKGKCPDSTFDEYWASTSDRTSILLQDTKVLGGENNMPSPEGGSIWVKPTMGYVFCRTSTLRIALKHLDEQLLAIEEEED